ncbi:hypothetical protein [Acinetobacter guillouiae]|uniref:hypothetical protein n=1 Tax=Acinetobacter guillouiae TaxID=106649 RepID=UPI003AF99D85
MAGGSQIIINKNGITIITPAKFEVKAGQHIFKSGAEVGVNIQGLPSYETYNEKFKILSPSGEEMPNIEYKVSSSDQNFTASTDRKGFTKLIYAELSGDFPLGDSRQPTYKSLRPFDLVS